MPLATGLLVVEALARRVLLGHNPLLWLTEGPAVGINFVLLVMLFAAFLASMAERMSQAGRG